MPGDVCVSSNQSQAQLTQNTAILTGNKTLIYIGIFYWQYSLILCYVFFIMYLKFLPKGGLALCSFQTSDSHSSATSIRTPRTRVVSLYTTASNPPSPMIISANTPCNLSVTHAEAAQAVLSIPGPQSLSLSPEMGPRNAGPSLDGAVTNTGPHGSWGNHRAQYILGIAISLLGDKMRPISDEAFITEKTESGFWTATPPPHKGEGQKRQSVLPALCDSLQTFLKRDTLVSHWPAVILKGSLTDAFTKCIFIFNYGVINECY